MNHHSIRPEDILAGGVESTTIRGTQIRKGTVAAFLANVDILENPSCTEQQKQEAVAMLYELAPAVIAVGLHHHVVFKNSQVEQILRESMATD